MDLGLPKMSGLQGIEEIKKNFPDLAIMVLSVEDNKDKVLQAINCGAMGYLLKSSSINEIMRAIEQIITGGAALGAGIANAVLSEVNGSKNSGDYQLSEREVEVLTWLAEGLVAKSIANKMHISKPTVHFHLGKIYQKLNVSSQPGAVAKALRNGLIG
jgi:DNA-binding NarL/FixJ family response regulator